MTSQRLIQEAKNFLRSGTPIPEEAVRPEILRSWKRCWGSHVPMEHGNKEILPLDAVEERIARRNSLCQVAFPYLDGLYDFIRGSEFLLLFSDEEGYILYARGDEDISRTARENGLVKGACRSESRLGTNGIGTVLVDRIPSRSLGRSTTTRYMPTGPAPAHRSFCPMETSAAWSACPAWRSM